jgi:hypothetical protein
MRRNLLLLIAILFLGVLSCKNDKWNFPDFPYTTTYFPYQYPVRTLVLGDYLFDNTNDNNLKFRISGDMGGTYTNKSDQVVTYQLAPELATNVITVPNNFDGKIIATSDTLEILPSQYYTLAPADQFIIPAGKFSGGVDIQLTDAFLNDPKAVLTRYVIPLRITSSTTDSVLAGKPKVESPNPLLAGDWSIVPKNFTLFAIKFVNAYHGKYLHRGRSIITNNVPTVLDTIIYHQRYVEQDEIWSLQTTGRYNVQVTGVLRKRPSSPGKFKMTLTFDANNDCTVTSTADSKYPVTGTGKFVKNGGMWGNVPQNAIFLNYVVTEGINTHTVVDTLVFRDKAVTFLEYELLNTP